MKKLLSQQHQAIRKTAALCAAAAPLFLLLFPLVAQASVDFASVSLDPLSQGLTAYWPFDGDTTNWTTNTTQDITGNGNTGTLNNFSTTTSPTIGKIGQALKFNGSSSYISTAYTIPAQSSATSFTWSTWVYLNSNSGTMVILGFRNGATWMKLTPNAFEYSAGSIISETLPTGKWEQVVIVKNGTNFTYYLNGKVIGTASNSSSVVSHTFYIGEDPGFPSDGVVNGMLDDVRIYNRALSYQEVELLYALGSVKAGNTTQNVSSSYNFGLSAGLITYWPLDGDTTNWTTGTTVDESGSGDTGNLVAMSTSSSPAIGRIGQALQFNGTSQYIVGSQTVNTSTVTESVWVKFSGNPASFAFISGFVNGLNGTNYDKDFFLNTNGTVEWYVYDGAGKSVTSTTAVTDGKWHSLIGVANGSTMTFYLDGKSQGSVAAGSTYTGYTVPDIFLNGHMSTTIFTAGTEDDFRIYNRALSYQEVQDLYKEGVVAIGNSPTLTTPANTGLNAGLVGYWTFDGPETNWGTGITVDSSGNGNNGVMTGMATTTSPTIGKIGQALKFNGTNSVVTAPLVSAATQNVSMVAWVYWKGAGSNQQLVFYNGNSGANGYGILIGNGSSGVGSDLQILDGGVTFNALTSAPALSQNKWVYLVITRATSTWTLYINGVASATGTQSPGTPSGSTYIGGSGGGSNFNGVIDDVRFYNRTLSAQEVQQLYASTR